MFKNKFFVILAAAAMVVGTGCKKELDLTPTDTINPEKALQNLADVRLSMNSAYARYGRINTMYVSALLSDELKFGPDNGGAGQFDFRYQYGQDETSGGNVTSAWGNLYSMIDLVNRLLAVVDNLPGAESDRAMLKAEMLSLRAIGYFELLNWYSKTYDPADPLGVPVVTESCLSCKPGRNTVAEVAARIDGDIAEAKGLFPDVTAATFNDLRLNKLSLAAFESRVAIYKREWQRAVDAATVVINSNIEPLVSRADFPGIWTDANTGETLFRLRYETATTVGAIWTGTSNAVAFSPSDKLLATYTAADVRRDTYIATGPTGGIGTGKRYVNKFFTSSRGGRVVDLKAIRTAEVYLNRAEAYAELNNLTSGAADLNRIRGQRITGYVDASYGSQATLISDILLERYKELAFEGFRFFDLKRRNLPVQRNASDVDSPNWQTLPAGSFRFTLPIPQYEFQANPAFVQNAGYQ